MRQHKAGRSQHVETQLSPSVQVVLAALCRLTKSHGKLHLQVPPQWEWSLRQLILLTSSDSDDKNNSDKTAASQRDTQHQYEWQHRHEL